MQFTDTFFLRMQIVTFSFLIAILFSTNSFALPAHTLTKGNWSLISIPSDPGSSGSVELLFGDDLSSDSYGPTGNWIVYAFDADSNTYRELDLSDIVMANTGYWIIQTATNSVELDLPDSLSPLVGEDVSGCTTDRLCATRALVASDSGVQWNLLGASFETPLRFSDTRFQANNTSCVTGCTAEQASAANLIGNSAFRFNGIGYESVVATTTLQPWDGIWLAVLPGAPPLLWLLPVNDATDPNSSLTPAEKDATRLLMQASYGATDATINEVLELGGPSEWIDAQLALPVQRHLPVVKREFPDKATEQDGRYLAFWEQSLSANDQLRQRVAFALSQFLVVSDRSTAIDGYGDLAASYYDVLLNNAFGNYRDLLRDVTLSPTMGLYLSMLGNDKPDSTTGQRADENYARELMQLFTIGLIGLDLDGTELVGVKTYTQSDVENLARAFTGWFWNVDRWNSGSNSNLSELWKPNRDTLAHPMVAFADHHDTDEKTVLDRTLPAGQTAEADLSMALDILFNHPNVGPFVSKQLIKRLVTSNPSNSYVRRVASIFNNNGAGVRGDLAAVIRAILLDNDARSPAVSKRTDFGKLREPLLRYAHLWRAFGTTDPIKIRKWVSIEIPQIAPLTAPSVFNYYSPSYSPPGAISTANLVAPEFQINSGSSLNTVNTTLMKIVQEGTIKGIPAALNIEKERLLLGNPNDLLNHLDRLLTAGNLTTISKQKLKKYIDTNRGLLNDDRLLRDVIGLIVTSTDFAVQR